MEKSRKRTGRATPLSNDAAAAVLEALAGVRVPPRGSVWQTAHDYRGRYRSEIGRVTVLGAVPDDHPDVARLSRPAGNSWVRVRPVGAWWPSGHPRFLYYDPATGHVPWYTRVG